MATIQIRDIPEETYETIRRRARKDGKSIQSFMREHLIEWASVPSKAEAHEIIEAGLRRWGPVGASPEEIVQAVKADRR